MYKPAKYEIYGYTAILCWSIVSICLVISLADALFHETEKKDKIEDRFLALEKEVYSIKGMMSFMQKE